MADVQIYGGVAGTSLVGFPELLQSLHIMQKFKYWYHLEDNSIRNNFGPSVQRSFHLGGQGAPGGHDPSVHTEIAVFPEQIMLVEHILGLMMRNRQGNILSYYLYSEISIHVYLISVNVYSWACYIR